MKKIEILESIVAMAALILLLAGIYGMALMVSVL